MTLYYTLRRFWFVPQLVERRLSAEGSPVGAGLPADARAVAVGRDRDRDVVEPEGCLGLGLPPPGRAGHDALLRLCLGLVLRGVDPEDLRALLLPAHLLNMEVIKRPRVLHPIQRLHVGCGWPVRRLSRCHRPSLPLVERRDIRGSDQCHTCACNRQASRHSARRPRCEGSLAQQRQTPPPASAAVAASAPAAAASPPSRSLPKLHLRGSLPGSLEQGLDFGRPADDLRRGHFVWWRAQSGRPPRNPQRAVQPVLAAPQGVEGPTLRKALAGCCCSCSSSGNDRLSRLNAALPQPAAQARGPRRVQPVVAQGLAWVHASVVAVRQEAGPGELSGRPRQRSSAVALVGCFKTHSCRLDGGVRRRGLADGLRGIGVIVKVPVTGSVDARLAVG